MIETVYIYQKYDKETADRNNKWLLAGGLIIVAGILVSAIEFHLKGIGLTAGFSGYEMFKLVRDVRPSGFLGTAMYFPAAAALIGAVIAGSSYMSMKGNDYLKIEQIRWLSIAAIALPVLTFMAFYSQSDDLNMLLSLFSESASILPGPDTLLQAAGGILVYKVAGKGDKERITEESTE